MLRKLAIAIAGLAAALALGLFLLTRPAVVNALGRHAAPWLGFSFELTRLELGPGRACAEGLVVRTGALTAEIPRLSATTDLLTLEDIDTEGATFRYTYDANGPATDLRAYLAKIPSLRRLRLRDCTLEVAAKDGSWRARLSHLSVSADGLSPQRGGALSFGCQIDARTKDAATQLSGRLSGSANLAALVPWPTGKATLSADLAGQLAGRRFQSLNVSLPLETPRAGLLRLAGLKLAARGLEVSPKLKLASLVLSLPATVDVGRRSFEARGIRADLAGLGSLGLALSGGWGGIKTTTVSFRAKAAADALNVAALKGLAQPAVPSLAGWQAGGRATLAADVTGRWGAGLSYEGEVLLSLKRGSFSSPDYTKAGENIAATVRVRLKSAPTQAAGFETQATLSAGQLLYGGVLADLAEISPQARASGQFFFARRKLTCDLGLTTKLLTATGRYEGAPEGSRLRLSANTNSLQRLFGLLVAEPRRDSWPQLAEAKLAGSARLDIDARVGAAGLGAAGIEAASGRVSVAGFSLAVPGTAAISGLDLDLPFDLDWRAGAPPTPEMAGTLRLAALEAAGVSARGLALNLKMAGDSLVVAQPITAAFYGGRLQVGGLTAQHLLSESRQATLSGVEVSAPLDTLGPRLLGLKLAGDIAGTLPSMSYRERRWQAEGSLVARTLGGEMVISRPWMQEPLLPSRSLGADVDFEGLSLEPLTALLTGFGKVTGTVRGQVRGLELDYGQPAAFDLLVESEGSDVPRRVSVQAVESISTIGTGTTAGLQGMFFNLLKEFRYTRIGIACSLRNDRFRLRGTIHDGGTEYLVRRTLLGGIDVVNRNPDNEISFKDMRERVERIFNRSAHVEG